MAEPHLPSLRIASTVVSDTGYVRSNNQDSGFAGTRIIAMADGMGGHAGGDTASTIAIRTLAHFERGRRGGRNDIAALTATLEKSILAAHDAIVGKAKKEKDLSGMGTTVDAVVMSHNHWILAHIGDSRAYLLRNGRLIRVSKDHSYVQHLVDTGRITPTEAKNHPQRSVVMRVLGDFDIDPHPDISVRTAHVGDRWLLCSDGLSSPLADETIRAMLLDEPDPEVCAQKLVNMALKAGSTDNVTAVIGDAEIAHEQTWLGSAVKPNAGLQIPLVGGAAAASLKSIANVVHRPVVSAPPLREEPSPAQRAAHLADSSRGAHVATSTPAHANPSHAAAKKPAKQQIAVPAQTEADELMEPIADTGEIPIVTADNGVVATDPSSPIVRRAIHEQKVEEHQQKVEKKKHNRWLGMGITGLVVLILAIGGAVSWHWSQQQYYLGVENGYMAVYQGVPTNVFGIRLSHSVKNTGVRVSSLPSSWQRQLRNGISADSLDEAMQHASVIKSQAGTTEAQEQQSDATEDATSNASNANNAQAQQNSNAASAQSNTGNQNNQTKK